MFWLAFCPKHNRWCRRDVNVTFRRWRVFRLQKQPSGAARYCSCVLTVPFDDFFHIISAVTPFPPSYLLCKSLISTQNAEVHTNILFMVSKLLLLISFNLTSTFRNKVGKVLERKTVYQPKCIMFILDDAITLLLLIEACQIGICWEGASPP